MDELEDVDVGRDEADVEDRKLDCDEDDFEDLSFLEDLSACDDLKLFDDLASLDDFEALDDLGFFKEVGKETPAFNEGDNALSAHASSHPSAEAAKQHTKINPLIFIANPIIVIFKTRQLTSWDKNIS